LKLPMDRRRDHIPSRSRRCSAVQPKVYGVDPRPQFRHPHHGSGVPDKNIPLLPNRWPGRGEVEMDAAALESRLAPMRQKLYAARMKRKTTDPDTKVITSWDALMIRALAHGGKILMSRAISLRRKKPRLLLDKHRTPDGGLFPHQPRLGRRSIRFLDDYAFLVQPCLRWPKLRALLPGKIERPNSRQRCSRNSAIRAENGLFFHGKGGDRSDRPPKDASDSPLPSGNAVAAHGAVGTGSRDMSPVDAR